MSSGTSALEQKLMILGFIFVKSLNKSCESVTTIVSTLGERHRRGAPCSCAETLTM